jgi:protein-S-isoprenylcysteine O-methyltransferase Ste14
MALREEFESQGNWLFRWRSYLPLLLLPLFIVALRESITFEKIFGNTAKNYFQMFCICVSFVGLFIRCLTIGYIASGTSGRNTKTQKAESLNTKGIYATVRHPLYLGNFIIFFGLVLFVKVWWFVIICSLLYWIYYERIMYREEEFLRKKFGETYITWAERTPAFLPKLNKWQRPDLTFSVKKVLQREYIGFFEIIACFTILHYALSYFNTNRFTFELGWALFFGFGLLSFIVLRILKKATKVLEVNR